MDSIQVGKAVFDKEIYTTLAIYHFIINFIIYIFLSRFFVVVIYALFPPIFLGRLRQFVHFKNVCPPPPSPSSILLDGSWRWPRWVNLGFLLAPFEPMIEPLTQGGDSILNPDRRNFLKFNNLYLLFSTVFHGLVSIYLTNALFTFLVILYLPYLKQLRLIALSIFSSQVPQSSCQQPQTWFRHSYSNIEAAHTKLSVYKASEFWKNRYSDRHLLIYLKYIYSGMLELGKTR